MRNTILLSLVLLCLVGVFQPSTASAAPAVEVSGDEAVLDFPNTATFRATLQAGAPIQAVVLEYGAEQQTCGQVVAKAFPQFTPDTKVNVEWTWEMRQSGSLPPGATIWWRWRVTDANGQETLSDRKTVTWLDGRHPWQVITSGDLRLHWYGGDKAFAQELLTAAADGVALNAQSAGLKPEGPIDLYIFANNSDLKDAILYEPSWTGGQAFPDFNIVIIGISRSDVSWGKDAIVHELTHVLVGHLTFSCLGDVPTWLNEGLAVYSEGGLDPSSQQQLDEAIRQDKLLSVRSLSGGFSEVSDKAYLSYSESYSIVKFLVEKYGQEKMTALLVALRDGTPIDAALVKVYGFDVEGLEDAWRAGIGAAPRPVAPNPTAVPSPTYVPTIAPMAGVPLAVTPTPFVVPTSSVGNNGVEPFPQSPTPNLNMSVGLVVILLLCCGVLVVMVAVVAIYFVVRGSKGG